MNALLVIIAIFANDTLCKELKLGLAERPANLSLLSINNNLFYRRVEMNGRNYYQFESDRGSILVLDIFNHDPKALEEVMCVSKIAPGQYVARDIAVSEIDYRLTDKFRAYAGMIAKTIETSCDKRVKDGSLPVPELGLSFTNGKGDQKYDVFYQSGPTPLKFRVQF